MSDRLTLSLTPHPKRSPNGAMRFDAGELVCTSHQPLFDGARLLLARGYPAETLLTTRHVGNGYDNVIPAPLGELAELTCDEANLRFRRWATPSQPVWPPMRKPPSGVPNQPDTEIALYGEQA
jgi:hypothetical protein